MLRNAPALRSPWLALLALLTVTGGSASADAGAKAKAIAKPCKGEASFSVTFRSHWVDGVTAEGVPEDVAFTPMIVAIHQQAGDIYEVGGLASPGIKRLAQTGTQTQLNAELRALRAARTVRTFGTGTPGRGRGQSTVKLSASRDRPMLTMISTVAPSPDWIVGINGVDLCQSGQWVDSMLLPLMAQDAGVDSGETFSAPDQSTEPQQPIQYLDTQLRLTSTMGQEAIFGTLSIKRH